MLYEQKMINELEWETYNTWYDFFSFKIDYFIYLKTDVDKCVERIKLRNRKGEETIPKEYLENLHSKHELWLNNKKNKLLLDGNSNINKLLNGELYINKIYKFICEIISE